LYNNNNNNNKEVYALDGICSNLNIDEFVLSWGGGGYFMMLSISWAMQHQMIR
jgi:hypothetical protein